MTDVQQIPRYDVGLINAAFYTMIELPINTNAKIGFRGSVYYTVIEGIQIDATPEQTRITVFMSGQDTNAYLILDNTLYGTLDNNKLGF